MSRGGFPATGVILVIGLSHPSFRLCSSGSSSLVEDAPKRTCLFRWQGNRRFVPLPCRAALVSAPILPEMGGSHHLFVD